MIKEYDEIATYINDELIPAIKTEYFDKEDLIINITCKYMGYDYDAFEICTIGNFLDKKTENKLFKNINKKFNGIIKNIYTVEKGKIYVIYLKSLEELRTNKINKLQNKLTNGI